LIPEDIDDTIQRSLHLGHAREDSLSHALQCGRDAGATNDCLHTRSIGSLVGRDSGNGCITIVFWKRQRDVYQADQPIQPGNARLGNLGQLVTGSWKLTLDLQDGTAYSGDDNGRTPSGCPA